MLENLIRLFAPHTCLGCGVEEDRLLCEGCMASLPLVPSRCYRCKAVTEDYAVCATCRPTTPLRQVLVYTHHRDLAKELVHRMKYERAQAGIVEAAEVVREMLPALPADSILTHIPTATRRVRQRGYDHAHILAANVSRKSNRMHKTLLARLGQAHQVGSGRTVRLQQIEHAFRVVRPDAVKGKHIVLVDDVLTSGATLETAARELRRAGAARVSAIVFAQA